MLISHYTNQNDEIFMPKREKKKWLNILYKASSLYVIKDMEVAFQNFKYNRATQ